MTRYELCTWAELAHMVTEAREQIERLKYLKAEAERELHRRLDEENTDEMAGEDFVVVREDHEDSVFNAERFRTIYPVEHRLFCDSVPVKGVRVYGSTRTGTQ